MNRIRTTIQTWRRKRQVKNENIARQMGATL